MVLRIIIDRKDHEVLGVDRVIHGLKDNYRQKRPRCIRGGQSDSWS
jgi:hypothetical protein